MNPISHTMRTRCCAAFSLVELAVTITIIGLLAGGVLAGRSYIRNAELNTMMSDGRYYINMFGLFQQKYNAIPGDMATASDVWPGAFNGDGNGMIASSSGPSPVEILYAFQHLSLGGYIDAAFSGTGNGGWMYASPGINVPISVITNVTYMFDHPNQGDGNVVGDPYYFDGLYFHVMRIAAINNPTNGLPSNNFLSPREALDIDRKYDDGKPSTGSIATPKHSAMPGCADSDDASAANYYTTTTANNCYLILKVQY